MIPVLQSISLAPSSLRCLFALSACFLLFPFCSGHECRAGSRGAKSDVPEWAKTAVWYQIFPERFRNGDPKNDPTVDDIAGSWPHETPAQWNVSRWIGDWYKLQTWEEIEDKGFYYRVQQRRYGGDLQGVIDKLDYLRELGVTALYCNPLFESPSLHKYDATTYHHIDNNFGPDPDGDKRIWETENPGDPATWKWTSADKLFLKLLHEAHRRGMKVIIDGVFNHVGRTFWAFLDVRRNGERSPYKDWFTTKHWDDPVTPEDEFDYEGWNNVRELPELREDAHGLTAGAREHVRAVVRRWMDPNGDGDPSDGIDGWRLDVAEKVAVPFWREFRSWVRGINPEAFLTGEVWWEDWENDKMFNAAPWLQGDMFDAVMNYRWAREVAHFFIGRQNKITASEFDARLKALQSDYRKQVNYVLMNLMDSHDTDRLGSHIVNADASYDKRVGVNDNPEYSVRKPNAGELRVQKLIGFFQMTYLGAPMIYYGDEAGMWGADDPDCRKPMLWAELRYDDEASHPFGKPRPPDVNQFNKELFNYYKKLVGIRRRNLALSLGDIATLLTDDARDAYAFLRSYRKDRIIVVINNSSRQWDGVIPLSKSLSSLRWVNIWDSSKPRIENGNVRIRLASKSGAILKGIGSSQKSGVRS